MENNKKKRCPKGMQRKPPKVGVCVPKENQDKNPKDKKVAEQKGLQPASATEGQEQNTIQSNFASHAIDESTLNQDYLQSITEKDVDDKYYYHDKALKVNEGEDSEYFENSTLETHLYPNLADPKFNMVIASKREFINTQYESKITKSQDEFEEYANKMCNLSFELNPHQQFVRNFLSSSTPYNSLLLYHGLGTGKTCTAIGVSEEMRRYQREMETTKRIMVIASPNVQDNFKLQLFDEKKLSQENGVWNLQGCTGKQLLRDINPMSVKGFSREKVCDKIRVLIKQNYLFLGYRQFANYIERVEEKVKHKNPSNNDKVQMAKKLRKAYEKEFGGRLIIIDEVHNVKSTSEDAENKKIARSFQNLVRYVQKMHLILLSATPLYNDHREIIFLLNIMRKNDKRRMISNSEIFDAMGNFVKNDNGDEIGKSRLIEYVRGYVSFVRGENPYTFPYRIFPKLFDPSKSMLSEQNKIEYPSIQMNNKTIRAPIEYVDVYPVEIGERQQEVYNMLIDKIATKPEEDTVVEKDIGYNSLIAPIQALNIGFPSLDETKKGIQLIGEEGLNSIMTYEKNDTANTPYKSNFKYRPKILEKYGEIFSRKNIGKYSGKIKQICDHVANGKGIHLIYNSNIMGGIIPMALALEEMGFTRYGNNKSLFQKKENRKTNKKYIIISGDKYFSPNNPDDVNASTDEANVDGNKIQVILISKAGFEGIDFKYIRHIHVMDPWYNMNRIEQIIGRGVRNCSHKLLPFTKRNVCIYLYGTILEDKKYESADMYLYRRSEKKALQIGKITRTLKESAVDCLLNIHQLDYDKDKFNGLKLTIELGNNVNIDYLVGDDPYSSGCDYMDKCNFTCKMCTDDTYHDVPTNFVEKQVQNDSVNDDTYHEHFTNIYDTDIIRRIKFLFREKYFYTYQQIKSEVCAIKMYPESVIALAIQTLLEDKGEVLLDKYDREGYLVHLSDLYLFQPKEMSETNLSTFERSQPIQLKHDMIRYFPDMSHLQRKGTNTSDRKHNTLEMILSRMEEDTLDSIEIWNDVSKFVNIPDQYITSIHYHYEIDRLIPSEKKKMIETYIDDNFNVDDTTNRILKDYVESKMKIRHENQNYYTIENGDSYDLYLENGPKGNSLQKVVSRQIDNVLKNKFVVPTTRLSGTKVGLLKYSESLGIGNHTFKMSSERYGRSEAEVNKVRKTASVCTSTQLSQQLKEVNEFIVFHNMNGKPIPTRKTKETRTNVEIQRQDKKLKMNPKQDKICDRPSKPKVCYLYEVILRYLDMTNAQEMRWFLTPVEVEMRRKFNNEKF